MKRLFLVRHAKSSWQHPGQADIERPLNPHGEQDAPLMGRRLAKFKARPDLIISSPAVRALCTARIVADQIGFPKQEIVKKEEVYLADLETLLSVLRNIDDQRDQAMLFGHNPGLTILVNYLSDHHLDNIPTCGICCIEFDIRCWKDISMGRGVLQFFDYPGKSFFDRITG